VTSSATRDHQSGSATVEFVLGITVMVLFLLIVLQLALYVHTRSVATTAARHGLDEARVVEGTEDGGVAVAEQFLDQAGRGLEGRSVTASRSPTRTTVRVTGTVITVVPGLDLRLDVAVDAPTERPTP
jgi:Flp pilus assembly protein TadG